MVGIAFDNFSGNSGDEAIGISVKKMLHSINRDYYELYSSSDTKKYDSIIIGGGHLIRERTPDSVYNQFRIEGKHILNAMGIHGNPKDLYYLNEYKYVSVRSKGDREKIAYIDNVSIVPCTSMLLEDDQKYTLRVKPQTIGIHIYPELFSPSEMEQFIGWCKSLIVQGNHISFIPITLYRNDAALFKPIVDQIGEGCTLFPQMGAVELYTFIGQLTQMITYSLHGAIFAYAHNIPFLLANVYEKNQFFMEDRGLLESTFKTIPELLHIFDPGKKIDYSSLIQADLQILREHTYIINSVL
ncbi:MAG: polysaccharide pyruvyl transferase family protein [Saprospiraceae bacterium]|nr:polysaccharide pyruvyl transferase family protein [Saprospiraceae bacterium]